MRASRSTLTSRCSLHAALPAKQRISPVTSCCPRRRDFPKRNPRHSRCCPSLSEQPSRAKVHQDEAQPPRDEEDAGVLPIPFPLHPCPWPPYLLPARSPGCRLTRLPPPLRSSSKREARSSGSLPQEDGTARTTTATTRQILLPSARMSALPAKRYRRTRRSRTLTQSRLRCSD